MEHFRAKLTGRLDPTHYRPALVEAEERITSQAHVPLGALFRDTGIGHTAAVSPHKTDSEAGVPFLAGGSIQDGEIRFAASDRVRMESHTGVMAGSRLRPGDVVVVRKGDLGRAATIPFDAGEANCSSEIIYLKPKLTTDAHFLSSFLNSRFGRIVFDRHQRGMMIPAISLYDVPSLPVPNPPHPVRTYIGGKVRQAESLRAQSRLLVQTVRDHHLAMIPIQPRRIERSWTHSVPVTLLSDNLAAEAYPSVVDTYLRGTQWVFLADLCESVFSGSTLPNAEIGQTACDQATSRSCSGLFMKRPCNRVVPGRSSSRWLRPGDLILTNAAHDRSYIGSDVTFFQGGPPNFPSTKVNVIRVDTRKAPASYIMTYLQTTLGFLQIQAAVRGISAGIAPRDMERIRIPVPSLADDQRARWLATDVDLAAAAEMVEFARGLTATARLLVEALIERKVTEAELIAAHTDPAADRALLARLKTDGLDGNGDPLFPDLDRLFELLADLPDADQPAP